VRARLLQHLELIPQQPHARIKLVALRLQPQQVALFRLNGGREPLGTLVEVRSHARGRRLGCVANLHVAPHVAALLLDFLHRPLLTSEVNYLEVNASKEPLVAHRNARVRRRGSPRQATG